MVAEWILIIIMSGGGYAVDNTEFESQKACVDARNFIKKKFPHDFAECFKKYKRD